MYTVVKWFIQFGISGYNSTKRIYYATKNHTRAGCAWVMSEIAATNILLLYRHYICLEIFLLPNIITSPASGNLHTPRNLHTHGKPRTRWTPGTSRHQETLTHLGYLGHDGHKEPPDT